MGHQTVIFGAIIEPIWNTDINIAFCNSSVLNNLDSISNEIRDVFGPSVFTVAENSDPHRGWNVEYNDRIRHFGASYKGSYSAPDDYFVDLFEELLCNLYWTEAHFNQAETDNMFYRRFVYYRTHDTYEQVKAGKLPREIQWERELLHQSISWRTD